MSSASAASRAAREGWRAATIGSQSLVATTRRGWRRPLDQQEHSGFPPWEQNRERIVRPPAKGTFTAWSGGEATEASPEPGGISVSIGMACYSLMPQHRVDSDE